MISNAEFVFCRCQAVGPAIDEKEDTETYDIGQVVANRVLHFNRCLFKFL